MSKKTERRKLLLQYLVSMWKMRVKKIKTKLESCCSNKSNTGKNLRGEIIGIGSYIPPKKITNFDLETMMNTSNDWIMQRTGIEQRFWVEDGIGTSELAFNAASEAIKNANINPKDIDLTIFATLSPDYMFPGSAPLLNTKLEIPETPALDIRQQCTGFLYGMSIADAYIRSGLYKTILLVGAEVHSTGLDKTPRGRDVSVLFGDGAGAVVISAKEIKNIKTDSCIHTSFLYADGSYAKELCVKAPGSAYPLTKEAFENGDQFPYMNGKKVYVHAVRRMCEVTHEAIVKNGFSVEDVDLFVFHQANLRINDAVAEHLKVSKEKVYNTIHKYGNTTAATIPMALYDAQQEGKLKKGMLVCSAAFGAGFTWAGSIYRW